MQNRILLLFSLLLAVAGSSQAQVKLYDPEAELSLALGLNSNTAYEMEAAVAVYPLQWVGVSLGFNVSRQRDSAWEDIMHTSNEKAVSWNLEEKKLIACSLIPSLSLRTPVLHLGKHHAAGLFLQADAGLNTVLFPNRKVTFNIVTPQGAGQLDHSTETRTNHNARWFYWRSKFSVAYRLDEAVFSAGCGVSNFDIYGGMRNIQIHGEQLNNYLPERENTVTFFISIAATL